jgi:phytoene/squalene synthetase
VIGGALHVAARLWENVRADRHRPPLAKLAAISDPERFVWRILPYAARSFSFCIAVLPRRAARTLAVAYCYCRMLDTCEDLAPDAARKEAALAAFLARFDDGARRSGGPLAPPPRIDASLARDARDAVYLLLLERASRVDAFFATLPPDHQEAVVRLVRRMGAGMRWAVATFAAQGGTLRDEAQRSRYCLEVLGHPMRFAEELQRLEMGLSADLPPERVALAAQAGEAIQLANVARDLEKDHAIGVTYLEELRAPPQPPSPARRASPSVPSWRRCRARGSRSRARADC